MTSYNTVPAAEEPLLQPKKSSRKYVVVGVAAALALGALASGHVASKFESTGKMDLIFIPFREDKCECKKAWSNALCPETQYRCPSKPCDSYHSRWCEVDSMCSSAQKDDGVYWKKCDDPELTVVEAYPGLMTTTSMDGDRRFFTVDMSPRPAASCFIDETGPVHTGECRFPDDRTRAQHDMPFFYHPDTSTIYWDKDDKENSWTPEKLRQELNKLKSESKQGTCDPYTWPDLDKTTSGGGAVCGKCKALVRWNNYGSTCDGYCSGIGLTCVNGWEEEDEGCDVKQRIGCDGRVDTSDAICECE